MRRRARIRNVWAWALIPVLLVSLLAVSRAYGAGGIDTGKACSVAFKLDGQYPELDAMSIPVRLYRVADVGVDGRYTALEGFQDLDFSSINSETTAETWSQMAEQASATVKADETEPSAETEVRGTGQAGDLTAGMYLIEAAAVQSPRYTYEFIPYLVALPGNYYAETGTDDWVYDVDTELKPEQQTRFGSLAIEKALDGYNATLGEATFVFQVEAELDGSPVYSDVVSLVFDGAGVKTLQVDKIPAGAQVTVTEVYSGAGYRAVTDTEQTAVIAAEGEEGDPALVRFENTYDQSPNSGTSIVNHFSYNKDEGKWNEVEQLKDSTGN